MAGETQEQRDVVQCSFSVQTFTKVKMATMGFIDWIVMKITGTIRGHMGGSLLFGSQ